MFRLRILVGLQNMHRYSMMKGSTSSTMMSETNPFRNKTFQDLERIIDNNISQNYDSAMCSLILRSLNLRIFEQPHSGSQFKANVQMKLNVFNKCISHMLNHSEHLTPDDINCIGKSIVFSQDHKYFKINENNISLVYVKLAEKIENVLKEDKEGKFRKQFYQGLLIYLQVKYRMNIVKCFIEYFIRIGFNTNEEIINLFRDIAQFNHQSIIYETSLEKILKRFLKINQNNFDKSQEWANPLILEVISIYGFSSNFICRKTINFVTNGFKKSLRKGIVPIQSQITFLKFLTIVILHSSEIVTEVEEHESNIIFAYQLFQTIREGIRSDCSLSGDTMIDFRIVTEQLIAYAHRHSLVLNKNPKEIEREVLEAAEEVFVRFFFGKSQNYESFHISNLVLKKFTLSQGIERQIVYEIMKHLNESDDTSDLVVRLRLYEYVTYRILEGKLNIPKDIMNNSIMKMENSIKKMDRYVLIRMYNICRLLNIKIKNMAEIFEYMAKNNSESVIENLSRTILKNYSLDLIKKFCLRSMANKDLKKNQQPINLNLQMSIWTSFKDFQMFDETNYNEMYKFWLIENQQFFRTNFYFKDNIKFLSKFASKEFSGSNYFTSVRAEVLIEMISFTEENPEKAKPHESGESLVEHALRVFGQSDKIKTIMNEKYRHSFFIKIIWMYHKLIKSYYSKKIYYRTITLAKKIAYILRVTHLNYVRDTRNIKKLITFSMLQQVNWRQSIKIGNAAQMAEIWFWCNINNLNLDYGFDQMDLQLYEDFKNSVSKLYGREYEVEFLIDSPMDPRSNISQHYFDKSIFPQSILEGTFSDKTPIKDSLLLNFLSYPKSISYLLRNSSQILEPFFRRLSKIETKINNAKIIESLNLFESFRLQLSNQTRTSFLQWINVNIQNLFQIRDITFPSLCLKLGVVPEYGRDFVHEYVCEEIIEGNFYLSSELFVLGYTGIKNQVRKMLELTKMNRGLNYFLEDQSSTQMLLINNLMGLVLMQNDKELLEYFLNNFMEYVVNKEGTGLISTNPQTLNQFFILVSVCHGRLNQKSEVTQELLEALGQNKKLGKVLKWITMRTSQLLAAEKIDCEMVETPLKNLSLPMYMFYNDRRNQRFLILHRNEIGPASIILEYLQKFSQLKDLCECQNVSNLHNNE